MIDYNYMNALLCLPGSFLKQKYEEKKDETNKQTKKINGKQRDGWVADGGNGAHFEMNDFLCNFLILVK